MLGIMTQPAILVTPFCWWFQYPMMYTLFFITEVMLREKKRNV